MINVGDVLNLSDNKKYVVVNKMELHNINYVYLMTVTKPVEILIATETNKNGQFTLEEIKDNDELDYILSKFALTLDETAEID